MNKKYICPNCNSNDISKSKKGYWKCFDCDHIFHIDDEPVNSMKIFLSYGHTEKKIVDRIYSALKERKHDVWIDHAEIKEGKEWRAAITNGIKESNGVLACLSKYSVRDPGVCLNEIAIAIGVRGGNIATILLEPEDVVKPPASVCHIQWIDMSEWKVKLIDGEPKFEQWFQSKMQIIYNVIESKESRDFVNQIELIKSKLNAFPDFSKQDELLGKQYVGREWLTQELENWFLNDSNEKLCVIYGTPGVGKSAFCAHYIHYNSRVAAGIFCEYNKQHFNTPESIIRNLAYLLACRLAPYRIILSEIIRYNTNLTELNISELFDYLIADPLKRLYIDGGHETMAIVIDGIDECGDTEKNALATVLHHSINRLPDWMRIIMTAREINSVKAVLDDIPQLFLHADRKENVIDIKSYFLEVLNRDILKQQNVEILLNQLAKQSGGIFLYAELITNALNQGKTDIIQHDKLPTGLSECLHYWFDWFFENGNTSKSYDSFFRKPFEILLASGEPLPTEELQILCDWNNTELNYFLRTIEVLLRFRTSIFGKQTIELMHKYLYDWLISKQSTSYQVSLEDGLNIIANKYYSLFEKNPLELTEYQATNLVKILSSAQLTEKLDVVMHNHVFFTRLMDLEYYCELWGNISIKEEYSKLMLTVGEAIGEKRDCDSLRDQSVAYNRVADRARDRKEYQVAEKYYKRSLQLRNGIVEQRGQYSDKRDLMISYGRMGDLMVLQQRCPEALHFYEKTLELSKYLFENNGQLADARDIVVNYQRMGNIYSLLADYNKSNMYYVLAFNVCQEVYRKRGSIEDKRDLCIAYASIAKSNIKLNNYTKAKEYYDEAYSFAQNTVEQRGSITDWDELAICYYHLISLPFYSSTEKLDFAQKALHIAERLFAQTESQRYHDFITILNSIIGDITDQGDIINFYGDIPSLLTRNKKISSKIGIVSKR